MLFHLLRKIIQWCMGHDFDYALVHLLHHKHIFVNPENHSFLFFVKLHRFYYSSTIIFGIKESSLIFVFLNNFKKLCLDTLCVLQYVSSYPDPIISGCGPWIVILINNYTEFTKASAKQLIVLLLCRNVISKEKNDHIGSRVKMDLEIIV